MPICGTSRSGGPGVSLGSRKPLPRKLVVCGDGAIGKTSLCNVFTRGTFIQVYEPTVFENYVHDIVVDDQTVELSLWDTAGADDIIGVQPQRSLTTRLGQEEFDRLRSLSYAETHVVMLCFSVDNPTSLENVESKWVDEILEFCPGVKIVLVALKCDMREDSAVVDRLARIGSHPVDYDDGLAVARRIRASRYLECSAKHNRGVNEVFYETARVSIGARAKGSSGYGAPESKCTVIHDASEAVHTMLSNGSILSLDARPTGSLHSQTSSTSTPKNAYSSNSSEFSRESNGSINPLYSGLLASPVRLQPSQNPHSRSTTHLGGQRRRSIRFEPFFRRGSGNHAQLNAIGSKPKPVKDSFHRRQSGSHALQPKKALDNHSYFTLPHPSCDLNTPDDYMRSPTPSASQPYQGRISDGSLGTRLTETPYDELETPHAKQHDRVGKDVLGVRTPRRRSKQLPITKREVQSELDSRSLLSECASHTSRTAIVGPQPQTPGDAWVDRFSSLCHINRDDTRLETGDTPADPKTFTSQT
ncbi:Rho GTPase [Tulasnella sp. 331]|nr:Rho GTPase [Tulasnella sp. 331]